METETLINAYTFLTGDKFLETQFKATWTVMDIGQNKEGDVIVAFNITDESPITNRTPNDDGFYWFSVSVVRQYIGNKLTLIDRGCRNGRKDVRLSIQTIEEAHENFDLSNVVDKLLDEDFKRLSEEDSPQLDKDYQDFLEKTDEVDEDILDELDKEPQYDDGADFEGFEINAPQLAHKLGYKFLILFYTLEGEDITCFDAFERYPELNQIEGLYELKPCELMYKGEDKEVLVEALINMDFGFVELNK